MTRKKSSKKQNRLNGYNNNNNVNNAKTTKSVVHAGTSFKIKGLNNLGNTCYFNSMLQMILHSPTFMTKLKLYCSNDHEINVKMPNKDVKLVLKASDVSYVEKELIKLWESDGSSISPAALRNALLKNDQFRSHFSSFNEHDSHEAFLMVLNIIKEAQVKRIRKAILDFYDCRMSVDKVSDEIKVEIKTLGKLTEKLTLLHSHFAIVIGSALKCAECSQIRLRFDDCLHIAPGFPLKSDMENNETSSRKKHDEPTATVDNSSQKKLSKNQQKVQKRMEKKAGRKKKAVQRNIDCTMSENDNGNCNEQTVLEPDSISTDLIIDPISNPIMARFFNCQEQMQLDTNDDEDDVGIELEQLNRLSPCLVEKRSCSDCSKLAVGTNSNPPSPSLRSPKSSPSSTSSSLDCQSPPEEMDMIEKFANQLSIENDEVADIEKTTIDNGNSGEDDEKSKFIDYQRDGFLDGDNDKGSLMVDGCCGGEKDDRETFQCWTSLSVAKDDGDYWNNDCSELIGRNRQNDDGCGHLLVDSSSLEPVPEKTKDFIVNGDQLDDVICDDIHEDKTSESNNNNDDSQDDEKEKQNNSVTAVVRILDSSTLKSNNGKKLQSIISATMESHWTRIDSRMNVDGNIFCQSETDLDRSLAKFVAPMFLESLVCESCSGAQNVIGSKKRETNHWKMDIFCHAPFVLPIYISRFKQASAKDRSAKNNQLYTYPFILNLSAQCSQFSNIGDGLCPVVYRLYGIIEHIGSRINTGHYVSYVCCPRDEQISQTNVTPDFISSDMIGEISEKYDRNFYAERHQSFWTDETIDQENELEDIVSSGGCDGEVAGESNFRWFRISDSHVEPVSNSMALSCQAFMLFYIRIR